VAGCERIVLKAKREAPVPTDDDRLLADRLLSGSLLAHASPLWLEIPRIGSVLLTAYWLPWRAGEEACPELILLHHTFLVGVRPGVRGPLVGEFILRGPGTTWPCGDLWREDVAILIASLRAGHFVVDRGTPSRVAFKILAHPGGVVLFPGGTPPGVPLRPMPSARCRTWRMHDAPEESCLCGYHAAYSAAELWSEDHAGLLIVTPCGRTFWHDNAWRAESYWPVVAVIGERVPLHADWAASSVPVVRVPHPASVAIEIAEELRAEEAIEAGPVRLVMSRADGPTAG
jgi:hypothetical protein